MASDRRWDAVAARDRGADGVFVYAVRSTGVYCRPSCPARRPRPGNVEYFAGPEGAEQRGYRPCRRCHPHREREASPIATAVAEACRFLDGVGEAGAAAAGRGPTLAELGRRVGLSPSHLQRGFKRLLGVTPRQYLSAVRVERAKARLRAGADVTTAIFDAGFGSSRAFYERAGERLGMAPSTYRDGGVAETISFATVPTPLGPLLVARTERGVCAVRFHDGGGAAAELRREFPAAVVRRDDAGLAGLAASVARAVAGGADPDVPIDVRGTAFQLRVWEALRAVPRGETRSYGDVAAAVGRPTAVRAVAAACAANPVAVLVPCHRVVAADGRLAGYRWGVDRKRALLEAER